MGLHKIKHSHLSLLSMLSENGAAVERTHKEYKPSAKAQEDEQ